MLGGGRLCVCQSIGVLVFFFLSQWIKAFDPFDPLAVIPLNRPISLILFKVRTETVEICVLVRLDNRRCRHADSGSDTGEPTTESILTKQKYTVNAYSSTIVDSF